MKKIGMVGIGLMGHGIASNIVKHGYSLAVMEHAGNQPLATLIAAGATTQSSASALAAASDVVILCVTGTPQVEGVPVQSKDSFAVIGTPSKGPSGLPRFSLRPAAAAAFRARSRSVTTTALSVSLCRAYWSRQRSSNSRGEILPARSSRPSSKAERKARGTVGKLDS